MSDAPIPGIIRLHMGVLGTRAIRPVLISDTVTVFMNNVLVSYKQDGGRVAASALQLTDAMVGSYWVLKTINVSEPVTVPGWTPAITDTVTTPLEPVIFIPLSEPVDPDPVPPTIIDTPEFTVSALNTIILLVPSETVSWTATPPSLVESVTMVPLNLYQPTLSETLDPNPAISVTDTVNTLLT